MENKISAAQELMFAYMTSQTVEVFDAELNRLYPKLPIVKSERCRKVCMCPKQADELLCHHIGDCSKPYPMEQKRGE
jgi:hypothetical protein